VKKLLCYIEETPWGRDLDFDDYNALRDTIREEVSGLLFFTIKRLRNGV